MYINIPLLKCMFKKNTLICFNLSAIMSLMHYSLIYFTCIAVVFHNCITNLHMHIFLKSPVHPNAMISRCCLCDKTHHIYIYLLIISWHWTFHIQMYCSVKILTDTLTSWHCNYYNSCTNWCLVPPFQFFLHCFS